MQEDAGTYRNTQGAIRVIRGRGCNESFRAAVDRSYDAPLSLMDTCKYSRQTFAVEWQLTREMTGERRR